MHKWPPVAGRVVFTPSWISQLSLKTGGTRIDWEWRALGGGAERNEDAKANEDAAGCTDIAAPLDLLHKANGHVVSLRTVPVRWRGNYW